MNFTTDSWIGVIKSMKSIPATIPLKIPYFLLKNLSIKKTAFSFFVKNKIIADPSNEGRGKIFRRKSIKFIENPMHKNSDRNKDFNENANKENEIILDSIRMPSLIKIDIKKKKIINITKLAKGPESIIKARCLGFFLPHALLNGVSAHPSTNPNWIKKMIGKISNPIIFLFICGTGFIVFSPSLREVVSPSFADINAWVNLWNKIESKNIAYQIGPNFKK